MAHSSLSRLCVIGGWAVLACLGLLLPLKSFAAGSWPKDVQPMWKSSVYACSSTEGALGVAQCSFNISKPTNASWGYSVVQGIQCQPDAGDPMKTICSWKFAMLWDDGSVMTTINAGDTILQTNVTSCRPSTEPDPVDPENLCTCPAGEAVKTDGSGCQTDCNRKVAEAQHAADNFSMGNSASGTRCIGGCEAGFGFKAKGYDGKWYGNQAYATGQTCGPGGTTTAPDSKPAKQEDPTNTCKAKTCPGTINGQSVCVPCQASESDKSETTKPDGTKVSEKTECTSGLCTTTIDETPPGGGAPQTTRTIEPLSTYCAKNPQASHCIGVTNNGAGGAASGNGTGSGDGEGEEKEPSQFGGSCGAAFTCKGDAIQCAIAQEQHKRNCALIDTPTPFSEAGFAAANGEAQPEGHPGRNVAGTSFALSSLISQDGGGVSGGCPSDVAIGYAGHSLTIPFSRLCGALQTLGQMAVACSMLAAVFIVFRS